MSLESPDVFVGDCHFCLRRVGKHAKNRGLGVLVTVRNKRHALEIRGASQRELREIRVLAEEQGIEYLKEVCGNGKRHGQARSKRKIAN